MILSTGVKVLCEYYYAILCFVKGIELEIIFDFLKRKEKSVASKRGREKQN